MGWKGGTTVNTKAISTIAAAAALGLAGLGGAAAPAPAVSVRLFRFGPGQLAITAGTPVTWTNQDDITHTVTSGTPGDPDGRFRRPLGGKGATTTLEFTDPGVYPYFCERHPSMRGEIRVN
jgi:plastocyanin